MPCRYEIDAERRLVRSYAWGVLTHDELEANRQRMIGDPAFNPDFDQLADCRAVTLSTLTADRVRQYAGHSTFRPTSRRAIVVRDRPSSYGVGRMFEIHRDVSGGETVRVFRAIEEAEEWLGLNEPVRLA